MNKVLGKRGKPPLSKELIDYLNSMYPDVLPRRMPITIEELARKQGERSVVDHLIDIYNEEI